MPHKLPELPFSRNALEPYISSETIDYHYGKHHAAYIEKLNSLLVGTGFEDMPLEKLIVEGVERCPADKRTPIFNNGAQVYNHTFYWNCIAPGGNKIPTGNLKKAIENQYGTFEKFKETFTQTAVNTFGSGWAWLVKNKDGSLEVLSTSNAGNPLTVGKTPLLTCDVWEHAYYIDYRNARAKYVDAFWNMVNWDYVGNNYK